MVDLDSLIEDGRENENLDFKAMQYDKDKHEALIKDVLSFANADIHNDRFIIIGIKFNEMDEKEILGIEESAFIDSAVYQQLIIENIEPELKLEYFSHKMKGKIVGIIRIYDCYDKPYMMKKEYGKLRKGECFIRKGSTQFRLDRRDLDKILNDKIYKINYYRLIAFHKENEYNLSLIDRLMGSVGDLAHLSLIPDEFSFYQALRISDSTNLYDPEFISKVEDYILIAKKVNMWKDLAMNWIVIRGGLHRGNTQNYIDALHEGKDIFDKMKIKIREEIESIND